MPLPNNNRYNFLLKLITLWFIFLCSLHYFSLRPLWLDENFVLENIKNSQLKDIFGPLKEYQVFPRAYLFIIKTFSQFFNYHVLALRFFPFVSMILAFFVWLKIYKKAFGDNTLVLLTAFSFAASYYLSYYAAEFKPYSMDVLVAGIFCLYLIYQKDNLEDKPSKLFYATTLALPFLIFISYSSFFMFVFVIYNLIRKGRKFLSLAINYTLACLLFIFLIFMIDIRHTLTMNALFSYWNDYFICTKSFYCFMKSFGEGLRKMVVWWFGNGAFFRKTATVFIPVFMGSIFCHGFNSFRKNKFKMYNIETVGLAIFLELIILGMLKKYPFTGARTTLFFSPFVFYFIIKGISYFKRYRNLHVTSTVFYCSFIIICGLNTFWNYLKLYD